MYKSLFKRMFDIVLSLCALLVLAIPMVIVAIVIKIDTPGPAIFKQKRIGIHKSEFTLYKFRSMPMSAPKNVATHQLAVETIQLTRLQKTIRRLSIDELPQLVNILFGQMSIIGPRPCLPTQADLLEARDQYGANDIRPGLTGWAQINGRDELEIGVKAMLDGEYTDVLNSGHGFAMDFRCFFGTIKSVLKSEGVVEVGTSQMDKSEGTELEGRK